MNNNNNNTTPMMTDAESVKVVSKMDGCHGTSTALEREEIRLRRQQLKSMAPRPRTMSAMSKKSSTNSDKYECEDQQPLRMTDYLEKRSKMLGWKRYWFVLDGHLLTYYKSKEDYEKISPFSGSINLGIATTVRPIQIKGCKGYPIQIVTRSQIYYLRSLEKPLLEKWLLALQETTSTPPKISSPFWTDPGVQFYRYSFAALSQWSLHESTDDITGSLSNLPKNFYLNHEPSTLRKKCHSFASLQHPSLLANSPKIKPNKSANYSTNYKSGGYSTGTNNSGREMSERGPSKVRQATSMLVLESSPQATELRRELAKKLSFGGNQANKMKPERKYPGNGHENSGPSTPRLSKHREEHSTASVSGSDENLHHYDEIIDFEAMYETCGDNSTNPDDDSSSGIYESVDSDPWEKLKLDQVETRRFTESRDRKDISNRNSLLPISEIPEAPSKGPRNFKPTNTNLFPIEEDKKLVNFVASSPGSSQDSLAHEGNGKMIAKKKKGIAGIFQKIFKKDEQRKKDKEAAKKASTMIITGPIDLKNHLQNQQGQGSNVERRESPPIKRQVSNPSQPERPKKNSAPQPPPGSQNVFNENTGVLDELKSKVGQLKRANSELTPTGVGSKSVEDSTAKHLERRSTIQSILPPEKKLNAQEIADIKAKQILPMTLLFQNSITEYQQKLAKFNRLSAHLNPSFVAMFKPNPAPVTLGQIGRSSSCKLKVDEPPLLPPKKKRIPSGTPNSYDYPCNNSPVIKLRSKSDTANAIQNIGKPPTIRELAKKNSAPDIMFPPSKLSGSSEILPHILNQKFEIVETKLCGNAMAVPPRPLKKNTCWAYNTYPEDFVNVTPGKIALQMEKNKLKGSIPSDEVPCTSCYSESHSNSSVKLAVPVVAPEINLPNPPTSETVMNLTNGSTSPNLSPDKCQLEDAEAICQNSNNLHSTDKIEPLPDSARETSNITKIEVVVQESSSPAASIEHVEELAKQIEKTSENQGTEISTESPSTGDKFEISLLPIPTINSIAENETPIEAKADEIPSFENISETAEPPQPNVVLVEHGISQSLASNGSPRLDVTEENPPLLSSNETNSAKNFLSPQHLSPTLSTKSIDIDNLDALSELSDDDSLPLAEIPKRVSSKSDISVLPLGGEKETWTKTISTDSMKIPEVNVSITDDNPCLNIQNVYENIKFATINTLVTEFEVVEETEDEMLEMYDDFPSEFITPIQPLSTTAIPSNETQNINLKSTEAEGTSALGKPSRVQSIRHSGIDELEKYLSVESHIPSQDDGSGKKGGILEHKPGFSPFSPIPRIPTGAALSRLGHSPAVNKLQQYLENN